MAQDFRNDVARAQGTTAAAVFTAGDFDAVIGIRCTNILTTTIKVDIYIVRSSANYYLCKSTPIPPGGSIELIQGGAKIVMKNGDVLWHDVDTASGLDIWVSYIDTISS
jgi:hypothetical protein|tara:strand:- start:184 stop:510 length:327 start_codon:yes stop_codon:yes gene_type:complete